MVHYGRLHLFELQGSHEALGHLALLDYAKGLVSEDGPQVFDPVDLAERILLENPNVSLESLHIAMVVHGVTGPEDHGDPLLESRQ